MKDYMKEETFVQLDVKSINTNQIVCNMYTGLLCSEIRMTREDYEYLLAKGFFTLTGKDGQPDSAGIYASTDVYKIPTVSTTA
ncbi:MAG TPA: hypothetical protein PKJ63_01420 [Cyclobacteriaceae bacterium]|nr:hypothetical protein [Cyclobacteriaceae bacterium]